MCVLYLQYHGLPVSDGFKLIQLRSELLFFLHFMTYYTILFKTFLEIKKIFCHFAKSFQRIWKNALTLEPATRGHTKTRLFVLKVFLPLI